MTINSLGIQPDEPAPPPSALARLADAADDALGRVARGPARAHHRRGARDRRRDGAPPARPRRAGRAGGPRARRPRGASPPTAAARPGGAATSPTAPRSTGVAGGRRAPRRARRRDRQRGRRGAAPARRGRPGDLRAHAGRQHARRLLHAARGRRRTSRHARGYALAVASLAAAVHLPLLGRLQRLQGGRRGARATRCGSSCDSSGARVGVAYFAELDTDMTWRGFGTQAAAARLGGPRSGSRRCRWAIDAIERGIARRSRRVVAPALGRRRCCRSAWLVQRGVDVVARRQLDAALAIAREEQAPLTTPQSPPPRDRRRRGPAVTRRARAVVAAVLRRGRRGRRPPRPRHAPAPGPPSSATRRLDAPPARADGAHAGARGGDARARAAARRATPTLAGGATRCSTCCTARGDDAGALDALGRRRAARPPGCR